MAPTLIWYNVASSVETKISILPLEMLLDKKKTKLLPIIN